MNNDLFKNKYRIPTARAQWWNYKNSAPYFVTICTQAQLPLFGNIINGEMNLNNLGRYAEWKWNDLPNHHSNIELIHFVVMPNHIHGLLRINNDDINDNSLVETLPATSLNATSPVINVSHNNETLQATSLQNSQNKLTKQFMTSISPKKGSLSTIIRSYKSAVTKYANANNIMFDWQPLFYDRIVRNDEEFIRIYDYISHNPKRWEKDELFSK